MSANENAAGLPRRQFLKLSGAAGAAAVLAGSGVPAGTYPRAAAQADLCGADGDKGIELWDHAKACGEAQHDPTHHPMPSYCKGTNADDVVLDGATPPGTAEPARLLRADQQLRFDRRRTWNRRYELLRSAARLRLISRQLLRIHHETRPLGPSGLTTAVYYPAGSTATGHGARFTTAWLTEPRRARRIRPRPWLPTTSRLAPSASRSRASAGCSGVTTGRIETSG